MIKINNLSHKYGNHTALKDISLNIECGMIGLLGENGAGKTTLMKLLSTLDKVQTGQIVVDEVPLIPKNYTKIRKKIGFMPQEFGFYSEFTVIQMLEYICLLENVKAKEIPDKIKDVLTTVNLTDKRKKKTKSLSGGMKRRLGLACAMINEPDILIVDEPTVGLDPEERIKMRNFLKKYSLNKTVILSTHIIEDISSICDELIVISKGSLLYEGKLDELVLRSPQTYEVICPHDELEAYKSKGTITDVRYTGDGCVIKLVSNEANFVCGKKIERSLETAYMHLLAERGA